MTTGFDICISRGVDNTADYRVVPIIFVPGVMGTRLKFTESGRVWDPNAKMDKATGVGMAWDWIITSAETQRKIMHKDTDAVLYTENMPSQVSLFEDEKNRGWESLSWPSYGDFLRWLNSSDRFSVDCPVYGAGYDWRQDLRDLGGDLARRVKEILEREGAEEYILVTHSMGGLVSRSMLRNKNYEDLSNKLKCVVHVVQPAVGAPVLYRRFFTGVSSKYEDWGFAKILGNTPEKFTAVMSGLSGPMQLLPTTHYVHDKSVSWLKYEYIEVSSGIKSTTDADKKIELVAGPSGQVYTIESRKTFNLPVSSIYEIYRYKESPAGLIDHGKYNSGILLDIKKDILQRIKEAEEVDSFLKDYKHERTWAIYGTGKTTDVETQISNYYEGGKTVMAPVISIRRNEGDGTVPQASGGALFPEQHLKPDLEEAFDPFKRQYRVEDMEGHEPAFNSKVVRELTTKIIKKSLIFVGNAPEIIFESEK